MTSNQDVEERWIATITHGRYLVHGGDAAEGAPLLVGCHGYGENADRHLKQLRKIEGAEGWLLCAVGALHPFYNTKTGEVIDSWMTSRGREQAIIDNVSYVSRVVAEMKRRYQTSNRLVFAGFSQGVAMAYRAAAGSGFPLRRSDLAGRGRTARRGRGGSPSATGAGRPRDRRRLVHEIENGRRPRGPG